MILSQQIFILADYLIIYLLSENDSTIFCRANQVTQQHRYIMTFPNILTHVANISHCAAYGQIFPLDK